MVMNLGGGQKSKGLRESFLIIWCKPQSSFSSAWVLCSGRGIQQSHLWIKCDEDSYTRANKTTHGQGFRMGGGWLTIIDTGATRTLITNMLERVSHCSLQINGWYDCLNWNHYIEMRMVKKGKNLYSKQSLRLFLKPPFCGCSDGHHSFRKKSITQEAQKTI